VGTTQVGIRELRHRLSDYLSRVRGGETIVITDRGRPIARIARVGEPALPSGLANLVAAGRAIQKPVTAFVPEPVEILPGETTSTDYVSQQRR
jgi:antitoxin (DNA-binding transcriptional repressor) of toxin-antitoxin stability system